MCFSLISYYPLIRMFLTVYSHRVNQSPTGEEYADFLSDKESVFLFGNEISLALN